MLKDDSKFTIQKFRDMVPSMNFGYDGYKDMPTWHRVYPAAEFQKDENGNLRMKAFNGLLLLSFRNILKPEDVQLVKKQAAFLPSTLIAVTGADGRSVEILVKFSDEKGELPTDEEHADRLYQSAYRHILPIYQSVIHAEIASQKPSIRSYFLLTLDTQPYYNPQAVALKVDEKLMLQEPTPSIPEAKSDPTDKKEKGMKGSKENIEKMMKYLNEKYDLIQLGIIGTKIFVTLIDLNATFIDGFTILCGVQLVSRDLNRRCSAVFRCGCSWNVTVATFVEGASAEIVWHIDTIFCCLTWVWCECEPGRDRKKCHSNSVDAKHHW
jgi:hypothetical protein